MTIKFCLVEIDLHSIIETDGFHSVRRVREINLIGSHKSDVVRSIKLYRQIQYSDNLFTDLLTGV